MTGQASGRRPFHRRNRHRARFIFLSLIACVCSVPKAPTEPLPATIADPRVADEKRIEQVVEILNPVQVRVPGPSQTVAEDLFLPYSHFDKSAYFDSMSNRFPALSDLASKLARSPWSEKIKISY